MRKTLVCSLALLVVFGCDKEKREKAQNAVKDAASKLTAEYEEAAVVAHAKNFLDAVGSRDLAGIKNFCTDAQNSDYSAIMTCYYDAFAIENNQGTDAARAYLAAETAKTDNSPAKATALNALNEYFQNKGSICTKELAGAILVLALEAKYPKVGGKIGKVIAEKTGLVAQPESSSKPTTSTTQSI